MSPSNSQPAVGRHWVLPSGLVLVGLLLVWVALPSAEVRSVKARAIPEPQGAKESVLLRALARR